MCLGSWPSALRVNVGLVRRRSSTCSLSLENTAFKARARQFPGSVLSRKMTGVGVVRVRKCFLNTRRNAKSGG